MTQQIVRKAIELVGTVLSYLFPSALLKRLGNIRDFFYTGYQKRRFAHFGNSVIAWHAQKLVGLQYITIGDDTNIDKDVQLTAWDSVNSHPRISIGDHCLIRSGCHITAINEILIGHHLLTGTNVLITDNAHGDSKLATLHQPPRERLLTSKGCVKIGNNVWLGNNVCVLPGVSIGDGVIVGANSVVTHDLPAYSIAVGIPATIIKTSASIE